MSENGQIPQPEVVSGALTPMATPAGMTPEQHLLMANHQLAAHINNLQGQVNFLENRVKEIGPKAEVPKYPSMDMPLEPQGVSPLPAGAVRGNCEGQFEVLPNTNNPLIAPPPEGRLRIMIGIPLLAVSYEFFESFLKFWSMLCITRDPRYEITYHFAYRRPVHMAEEYLVKTAMSLKCTHILLMDDDIFDVTPDMLNKLVEANKEMISGVMYASKFPHAMCVFRRYDTSKRVIDMPSDNSMYRLYEVPALCPGCKAPQSHWDAKFCISCGSKIDIAVQECDLVPFPFTLIDLKVFDKIKKPWFHCTNEYPTDSWFCDRLMEAGIKPHAHMLVRLNHAGVSDATKPHFVNMGVEKMNRTKAVVVLSPDQMEIHQTLLVNRMKEVESQIKPKPPIIHRGRLIANPPGPDVTLITADKR